VAKTALSNSRFVMVLEMAYTSQRLKMQLCHTPKKSTQIPAAHQPNFAGPSTEVYEKRIALLFILVSLRIKEFLRFAGRENGSV